MLFKQGADTVDFQARARPRSRVERSGTGVQAVFETPFCSLNHAVRTRCGPLCGPVLGADQTLSQARALTRAAVQRLRAQRDSIVYGIAFNTRDYGPSPTGVAGPSDSLNIALVDESDVTAGTDTTPGTLWEEHSGSTFMSTTEWAPFVPAVQFKASNSS